MRKFLTPILLIQLLVTSYPGLAAEGSLFECRQIDNQRIPLRNEDKIIIREAALGSYLMEKLSGSGSIRVKRLD